MKKILVIDDEAMIVDVMKVILEDMGYQVTGFQNSQEGETDALKNNYDLILVDVRMPEKNGIDLMHEVKAKYPDLPVVIITGYPLAYPPEKAMAEGADGYIAKPFRINQIDKLLAKLLYSYESKEE